MHWTVAKPYLSPILVYIDWFLITVTNPNGQNLNGHSGHKPVLPQTEIATKPKRLRTGGHRSSEYISCRTLEALKETYKIILHCLYFFSYVSHYGTLSSVSRSGSLIVWCNIYLTESSDSSCLKGVCSLEVSKSGARDLVFHNAWKQLNVHDTRFVSVIKVFALGGRL